MAYQGSFPVEPAAARFLDRRPALFIEGEWASAHSDERLDVYDPATGKVIAAVVDASAEDVDRAVRSARAAFDDGRWRHLRPKSYNIPRSFGGIYG